MLPFPMPLVKIHTNVSPPESERESLAAEAGAIVAEEIGKPESIMMARLEAGACLTFGGTAEPSALFEIEGIELSADPTEALCHRLSDLAEARLGAPAARVFVKLTHVPRGAWAGNRKVY